MSHAHSRHAVVLLAGLVLAACTHQPQPEMSASSSAASSGWQSLFDGRTLAGWHGYHQTGAPTNWAVVDGTIQRMAEGADLVTDRLYGNFELELDWKITPGGNSGILYRVADTGEETYFTGP